ncbi:ABC-F family ATP-binding cassette domain-containing protein [Atopobium fossor]|uniref:ABC-F family ATP-binding cassette domain-containing protein n=1 Tax=Atopobium fossor TaxID=39487 RepID=UPI0004177FB3|nr:ABC-F family ATP-binding cassette domain-containing protein [Atopobium fossor]
MGILIGCEKISHEWPGKKVLSEQTIGINEGDRIGIVGKNGDGKSTLLQLISHTLEPDSGVVTWRGGIGVGYLSQVDALDNTATIHQAVVGDMPDYEWASNPTIREILSALLPDVDWEGIVGELSGGQRRRVDLARVLIGNWDVLLMDEPTNHLDMGAISWLAEHLTQRWQNGQGALLVVTHDRWFLDKVCLNMWEVHDGVIDPFEGGYSAYIQQRVERERQAAVIEERRQNMLRKELNWLAHGAKARTSKPKFRIDAAMELIANDPPLRNPLELKRLAIARLGKMVIEMKDAGFSYIDTKKPIFSHIDWLIGPGDRYGILGENGAGKTTLLKLMTGRTQPTQGSVRVGKSVRFGFLTQNLDALADKQNWRVNEVLHQYKSSYYIDGKAYSPERLLERLGFDTRELMSRVCDISGGQARRLAIMCVLLEEPNVLVLDEPGNDLDTDMLAILEDLLDSWPGSMLVVTHDRYVMERVTDNQFALIDGKLRHVPGGVDEYLRLLKTSSNRTALAEKPIVGGRVGVTADVSYPGAAGIQKLSNAQVRELRKRHDSVERKLATASKKPTQITQLMHTVDPTDFAKLQQLQEELEQAQARVEELEIQWLELEEALEEQKHA